MKNEATEYGLLRILTTRTLGKSKLPISFAWETRLDRRSNSSALRLGLDASSSRMLVWIGRALLILSAVSLSTMPLTQHLWTWDRFLHGGQDFELGALAILIFLSLVLVLCRNSRQRLDWVLAGWRLLQSNAMSRRSVGVPRQIVESAIQVEPNLYLFDHYCIPIRI